MPGKCSICTHENVAQMESLADSGESIKTISEQFRVSRFSLSRHINHHRNLPPGVESAGDDLKAKSDLLWERSNLAWRLAERDEDVRGLVQSVQTSLRSLELAHKQAERKAEAALTSEDDRRVDIADLDGMVSLLTATYEDPADQARLELALAEGRRLNRPDFYEIFLMVNERQGFGPALREFAATWKLAQKGDADATVQAEAVRAD